MNEKDIFVGNIVWYACWLHIEDDDIQKHAACLSKYEFKYIKNNKVIPSGVYIKGIAMCLISEVNDDGTVTLSNFEGGGYVGVQPSEIFQNEKKAAKSFKLKNLKAGISPIHPWSE